MTTQPNTSQLPALTVIGGLPTCLSTDVARHFGHSTAGFLSNDPRGAAAVQSFVDASTSTEPSPVEPDLKGC